MAIGQADRTAESFQGLLLRHRGRTGLTQRQLAARVAVSRGSVQDWEAGLNYPDAHHLQALIVAFLEAGGLTVGREATEAEALWAAALRAAPRMQTPFDRVWLAGLLAAQADSATRERKPDEADTAGDGSASGASEHWQDWGEAPGVLGFVGRAEELSTLRAWVLDEQCRLAAVLGMGGIGKTTLAARLAQDVAPSFQRVYWRSLRDALPVSEWSAGAIAFVSDQRVVAPEGEAAQRALLLQLLQKWPTLLVLDNFETLLEPAQTEGRYRDGYAGYGRVLQAIGQGRHQSCLLVTSREAPPELVALTGGAVRTLQLSGLGVAEGQRLLADKQLLGNTEDWAKLISRFGGNGLALKVVGESIREVFGGDIHAFLEQSGEGSVYGGIRRLLAEQIGRSSALEQNVLRVLAVEREPVTVSEPISQLGPRVGRGAVLEAIEALRRRSLVDRVEADGAAALTLQSVVLEYVTDRMVDDVCKEIARGQPMQLLDQPVIKAQTKDYVRQSQERLIGEPVLQRLEAELGSSRVEERLLALLEGWRDRTPADQGYGPGNVVNLLRMRRGELRGLDLGRLAIRQAYLAGVDAQDASLAGAHLSDAVLAEAFNFATAMALSGDGSSLAVGTNAGEVWLWRVADRTPLLAIKGQTGIAFGVGLSADGRLLAASTEVDLVRLWEAPSGRLLNTLHAQAGGVCAVTLSADGRLLVASSQDGTIQVWLLDEFGQSSRQVGPLKGHTRETRSLALSADGRLLASGSEDGTVRLWEMPSGRQAATLEGHSGVVSGVALSADGRLVASASHDGMVRLWEAPSGRPIAALDAQADVVRNVALSAGGRLLASGREDGTVRLWSLDALDQSAEDTRPLATLRGHTGLVWGLALSTDERLLVSGGSDGTIRMWEVPSGRLLTTLQGRTGGMWGLAPSADGRLLASGSDDGTVRLWEAPTGRLITTMQGHTGVVRGVALSADGRLLASGGFDGIIHLWEAPSGRQIAKLHRDSSEVWAVALSADGQKLASGSRDGTLRLWDTSSGRLRATLQGHTGVVWDLALSADGRVLASGSWDGTVRLWDTTSGRQLATLEGHTGMAYGVSLTADGQLLASGGEDGTVRLWEATTGRPIATLLSHTGGVRGVALSSDGRLLATGGLDGTVRLWEVPSGRPLNTLAGHTSVVYDVALSADGHLLASASSDGTIRLWETTSGAYLHSLQNDRRYERMDITGLTGVTAAQRAALLALGALDHQGQSCEAAASPRPRSAH
jgi:WD40 repeat protein/transcriptional regulator with XRE-family HTH domain